MKFITSILHLTLLCLVTFSASSQTLFWSEEGGAIKAENLNSGNVKTLFEDEMYLQILDIFLDRDNQRVFFSAPNTFTSASNIMVVDYNGENLTILGQSDFELDAIFYDSDLNIVYFMETFGCGAGACSDIKSLDVNGIFTTHFSCEECHGLTYNSHERKFYFFEDNLLISINADGTNREILDFPLHLIPAGAPLTLDADNKEIYWNEVVGFLITEMHLTKSSLFSFQPDSLFSTSSTIDTLRTIGKPTLEPVTSQLYMFFNEHKVFPQPLEIIETLISTNLDGSNNETLFKRKYLMEDYLGILDFEIDSNYGDDSKIKSIAQYNSKFDTLNFSNQNQTVPFKVCADGSEGSIFDIDFNEDVDVSNIIVRISEDPDGNDVDKYGTFSNATPVLTPFRVNYQHPLYIGEVASTFITINAEIVDISNNEILGKFLINVYRAPVLMVHGVWSNSGAFASLISFLKDTDHYKPEFLHAINYPNADRFNNNFQRDPIKNGIEVLIDQVSFQDVAIEKVDILAHSMGGILSRLYIQSEKYEDNIHKFITLNTPHSGSHLANVLQDDNVPWMIDWGFCRKMPCGGAEIDLQVGSPAIINMNQSKNNHRNIPIHAIFSNLIPSELNNANLDEQKMIELIGYSNLNETQFNQIFNEPHDIIVAESSQIGGLQSDFTSQFKHYHVGIQEFPGTLLRILELLNANVNSGLFSRAGFNPPQLGYQSPYDQNTNGQVVDIEFTNLSEGQKISYGESITINIEGDPSLDHHDICINPNGFLSCDYSQKLDGNTSSQNYTFTPEFLGDYRILVTGFNEEGTKGTVNDINVFIDTEEIPTSIVPQNLFMSVGRNKEREVFIDAIFNSFHAEISNLEELEFIFGSGKASRVENNIIRGEELGEDILTIRYKGIESSPIRIHVFESSSDNPTSTHELSNIKNNSEFLNISKIYPNPTENNIIVDFTSPSVQIVNIKVFDVNGTVVFTTQLKADAGENLVNVRLKENLTRGIYMVSIQGNSEIRTAKFIKH